MIKYYFIALTAMLSGALSAHSQKDSSGIYLTAEDFSNKKLTYAVDCRKEKHKIKLNDFFMKSYVTVIHNGVSYDLNKSDIYGYKSCDGRIIRFLGKKELSLLNVGEAIAIYRYDVAKPPRGKTNVTNYYFSKDAKSPVLQLTMSNLKTSFSDSPSFVEEVEQLFKYNTELAQYDALHKMYKLNWLLQYAASTTYSSQ